MREKIMTDPEEGRRCDWQPLTSDVQNIGCCFWDVDFGLRLANEVEDKGKV
jgi:hypothetical protein